MYIAHKDKYTPVWFCYGTENILTDRIHVGNIAHNKVHEYLDKLNSFVPEDGACRQYFDFVLHSHPHKRHDEMVLEQSLYIVFSDKDNVSDKNHASDTHNIKYLCGAKNDKGCFGNITCGKCIDPFVRGIGSKFRSLEYMKENNYVKYNQPYKVSKDNNVRVFVYYKAIDLLNGKGVYLGDVAHDKVYEYLDKLISFVPERGACRQYHFFFVLHSSPRKVNDTMILDQSLSIVVSNAYYVNYLCCDDKNEKKCMNNTKCTEKIKSCECKDPFVRECICKQFFLEEYIKGNKEK